MSRPAFLTTLILLTLTTPAQADAPAAAIADVCRNCHGTDSNTEIPPLPGAFNAASLKQKLQDYKTGQTDATIMPRIVKGYSDAELNAVADYFTTQNPN